MINTDIKRQLYAVALSSGSSRGFRSQGGVAMGSVIGSVRSQNQDVALHVSVQRPIHAGGTFSVALVCDGMGGLRDGKEAAALASASFVFALLREVRLDQESCVRAVRTADAAVHQQYHAASGTTLSAVVIPLNKPAWGVHAGDSRIFELNDQWEVVQVSKDDNLRSALREHQEIDRELGERLIQFVGMGDEIEPQIFQISSSATKVLITTDGAHSLEDSIFKRVIKNCATNQDAVRRLLTLSEYLGGVDNATVVISSLLSQESLEQFGGNSVDVLRLVTPTESIQIWSAHADIKSANREERPHTSHNVPVAKRSRKKKSPKAGANNVNEENQLKLDAAPAVTAEFPKDTKSTNSE